MRGSAVGSLAWWDAYRASCQRCLICGNAHLLDPRAFPLFQKNPPRSTDLLFILEAPNRDDTYKPDKGHLTIGPDTDPSGTFFYYLFTRALGLDIADLFVTNSVLCLPAARNGKRPVTPEQRCNCLAKLRESIQVAFPLVVCTVGVPALKAADAIEEHGLEQMRSAVAKPHKWYGRILFPVYHTGRQARNAQNGRPEPLQFLDWQGLRRTLDHERHDKQVQRTE
jgi:uracil-DNA glycosylase family 4